MGLSQHDRRIIKQPDKGYHNTNNKGKFRRQADPMRKPVEYYDYVAYFDGSIKENPHGEMGYGCIIYDREGEVVYEYAGMMPKKQGNSVNVAEYLGLQSIYGFLNTEVIEGKKILINGDSLFVIKQARQKFSYARQDAYYYNYMLDCKAYTELSSNKFDYRWIPREDNSVADALSTKLHQ